MTTTHKLTITALSLSLCLSACNSNDHDQPATSSSTVKTLTVAPSLGKILNAKVVLKNAANPSQVLGTQVTSNNVADSGMVSFNVPAAVSNVIVEISKNDSGTTQYFDEATNSLQDLPTGQTLHSMATLINDTSTIGVTAFTEAAYQQAAKQAGGLDKSLSSTLIAQANKAIADTFGVSNILLPPVLIGSAQDYAQIVNTQTPAAQQQYALKLAALAQAAKDQLGSSTTQPALKMAQALAADLADGQFDGKGSNLPSTLPYNTTNFQQNWQQAATTIAQNIGNMAGTLTSAQQAALTQLVNATPFTVTLPAMTCASMQLATASATTLTPFAGDYTVDIFTGTSKTGSATLTINGNGTVTLANQTAHAQEICGPSTQSNGSGILLITDKTVPNKPTAALINLFKDNSGQITAEGDNYTSANSYFSTASSPSNPLAVTGFSPTTAKVGDQITLNGSGFGTDIAHLLVKFSNNITAEVVSTTDSQLVVKVPSGAVSGPIIVSTLDNQSVTSSTSFTLQASSNTTDLWTGRASPSQFMLSAVTFGNGQYVAVGAGKTILTSTDGISWTTRSGPDSHFFQLNNVIYDGSQFIVGGNSQDGFAPLIATSPDGITWTRQTWTVPTDQFESQIADIAADSNKLTAVGMNGIIMVSTDHGVHWSAETQPNNFLTFITGFRAVTSNGSIRIAVGRNSGFNGGIIMNNGSGWQSVQSDMNNFDPRDVIWTGNQFVAVGGDSSNGNADAVVMTSPDGTTWTRHAISNAPSHHHFNAVVWDGTTLYAVGDDSQASRMVMSSTDGITWTLEHQSANSNGLSASLAGVATASTGHLVAVGGSKMVTKP